MEKVITLDEVKSNIEVIPTIATKGDKLSNDAYRFLRSMPNSVLSDQQGYYCGFQISEAYKFVKMDNKKYPVELHLTFSKKGGKYFYEGLYPIGQCN